MVSPPYFFYMKRPILPILFLALLAGCTKNVVLDNPGIGSVTFTIDGSEKYELKPGTMEKIGLDEGKHRIQIMGNGVPPRDTTINIIDGGVLHTGASNYVVFRQLYGLQTERKTLLNERWVEFDSSKVFGDIKFVPADVIYLEKSWDYGLDESFPESRTLMISKDFVVEGKVFRSKEFIQYLQDQGALQKKK